MECKIKTEARAKEQLAIEHTLHQLISFTLARKLSCNRDWIELMNCWRRSVEKKSSSLFGVIKIGKSFNLRSNRISPNFHKSKIGSSEVDFGGLLKKIKQFFFIPNFVNWNYNWNRDAVKPTESIQNFMVILGNRVTESTLDSRLHKRTYLYTHYTVSI